MRYRVASILLASCLALAADEPQQAGDRADDRAAIRAHIDRIFQAFERNSVPRTLRTGSAIWKARTK